MTLYLHNDLPRAVYIWYTGINFVLQPYIPQHSPQIRDEVPKTGIDFSILRNTCIWVSTSLSYTIMPHSPTFKVGEWFLKTEGDPHSGHLPSQTLVFKISSCGEEIRAKLYLDFTSPIDSCLRQNCIHYSLLQQKHLMFLIWGSRMGSDQLSHL